MVDKFPHILAAIDKYQELTKDPYFEPLYVKDKAENSEDWGFVKEAADIMNARPFKIPDKPEVFIHGRCSTEKEWVGKAEPFCRIKPREKPMGIVFYKVNDCCGDIETKVIDAFEIKKAGSGWELSKERAIKYHDMWSCFIDSEQEELRRWVDALKSEQRKNEQLRIEIKKLKRMMDSATVSFWDD